MVKFSSLHSPSRHIKVTSTSSEVSTWTVVLDKILHERLSQIYQIGHGSLHNNCHLLPFIRDFS